MRLNKEHKTAIIENATRVPRELKEEKIKQFRQYTRTCIMFNLPAHVLAVWDDNEWSSALKQGSTVDLTGLTEHRVFNESQTSFRCRPRLTLEREVPVPSYEAPNLANTLLKPQLKVAKEFISEIEQLADKEKEIEKVLNAELASVQTLKRLLEQWPECADYLPESLKNPKVHLPAPIIDTDKIKKLLSDLQ